MKRVQGLSLSEKLQGKRLTSEDLKETLSHLQQVCQALEFAHSRRIIHRDINPKNLILAGPDERPHVTLVDFGQAIVMPEHSEELAAWPASAAASP